MANYGFNNIKVALAFAGMTILGVLMIVGTSENQGVLSKIANRSSEEVVHDSRDHAAAGGSTTNYAPEPVWGTPVNEVSDNDFLPESPVSPASTPGFAPPPPSISSDPAKAPLSPDAIISTSDDGGY